MNMDWDWMVSEAAVSTSLDFCNRLMHGSHFCGQPAVKFFTNRFYLLSRCEEHASMVITSNVIELSREEAEVWIIHES